MKIIFMDIDGVLNRHEHFENGFTGICFDCVQRLNAILAAVPDARIVLSSAWRYMMLSQNMTLSGFENLLLTHGVNCRGRLHGYTGRDVYDKIPKTSDEWSEVGLVCRVQQIRDYASSHFLNGNYVIIDDLPLEVENFVKTDSKVGLTDTHVKQVIEMLTNDNNVLS